MKKLVNFGNAADIPHVSISELAKIIKFISKRLGQIHFGSLRLIFGSKVALGVQPHTATPPKYKKC